LGLEKPATGEQAGTWGVTANSSYDFLDTGIDGNVSIPLSASNYTLMTSQGVASNGRNKVIIFGGALTQDGSITIAPNTVEKIYFILNQTSGGFGLVVSQGTGSTYRIAPGKSAIVYATGTGAAAGVSGVLANFQCDTLLAVTSATINNLTATGSTSFSGPQAFTGAATFSGGVTISPSLALNLGSDANYDMYYRNASGQMARLPLGASGQLLEATASGPAWATVSLGVNVGMPIGGAQANKVFFADPSGLLTNNSSFTWVSGVGLAIGNPTVSHSLQVGGGGSGFPAEAWFDNPSGSVKRMVCATNGVARAYFGVNAAAESGGDVGSNPVISSINDAGSVGWTHFFAFRNNGHVSLGGVFDLGGIVNITAGGQLVSAPLLVVRGQSGQAGDLQQWQNSGGSNVARLDANGSLTVGASLTVGGAFSPGSVDTHGPVVSGQFSTYDGSNNKHDGFTGQISTPSGIVNCMNGIIIRN
jgi:hypothetical protein